MTIFKKVLLLSLMYLCSNPIFAQKNVSDFISVYTDDSIGISTSIITNRSFGKVSSKYLQVSLYNVSTKPIYVLQSNYFSLYGIENGIVKKKPKAELVVQAQDWHGTRVLKKLMPRDTMQYRFAFKDARPFAPITSNVKDYSNEYDAEIVYLNSNVLKEKICALKKSIEYLDDKNICLGVMPNSIDLENYYLERWGVYTKIRNNQKPAIRKFTITFPKK